MTETLVVTFAMWIFSLLLDERSLFGRVLLAFMFLVIPVVSGGVYLGTIPGFIIREEISSFIPIIPTLEIGATHFFKILSLSFLGLIAYLTDTDTLKMNRSSVQYYFLLPLVVFMTMFQTNLVYFMSLFEVILLIEVFAIRDKAFRYLVTRRKSILAVSILLLMIVALSSQLAEDMSGRILSITASAWLVVNAFYKNQSMSNWGPKQNRGFYWFATTSKLFLLLEFINQKFLWLENFDGHSLLKLGWVFAGLTVLSQLQRKRFVEREPKYEFIRSLLIAVFGVAGTVSLLFRAEAFEICGLFILFTGISILVSLYSNQVAESHLERSAKLETLLFLFPSVFIIGLPLTFGQVFYSWAWGRIYSMSLGLFIILFAAYVHILVTGFQHFRTIMMNERAHDQISLNWGKREAFWFFSILAMSLLNLFLLKVHTL